MKTRFALPLTLIVCGLLAVGAAAAQEKQALRLKLDASKPVRIKTEIAMSMLMKSEMLPEDQKVEMTLKTVQSIQALSVKEGWTKTKVTYGKCEMAVDAAMPVPLDAAQAAAQLDGSTMTVEVDPLGKTRNPVMAYAKSADESTKQMAGQMLAGANQGGFLGNTYPEQPVGVGDKWTIEIDMSKSPAAKANPMITSVSGKLPMTYEVLGFEKVDGVNCIKLKTTSSGKITMEMAAPGVDKAETVIKGEGTAWIELATGLVFKAEGKSVSDTDLGMMKMTTDQKVTMSRVK